MTLIPHAKYRMKTKMFSVEENAFKVHLAHRSRTEMTSLSMICFDICYFSNYIILSVSINTKVWKFSAWM